MVTRIRAAPGTVWPVSTVGEVPAQCPQAPRTGTSLREPKCVGVTGRRGRACTENESGVQCEVKGLGREQGRKTPKGKEVEPEGLSRRTPSPSPPPSPSTPTAVSSLPPASPHSSPLLSDGGIGPQLCALLAPSICPPAGLRVRLAARLTCALVPGTSFYRKKIFPD